MSIFETMKELKGNAIAMRGKCTIIWSVFTMLQRKPIEVVKAIFIAMFPSKKVEVVVATLP